MSIEHTLSTAKLLNLHVLRTFRYLSWQLQYQLIIVVSIVRALFLTLKD